MPLELFESPIKSYAASELNDVLYMLFGELTAYIHDKLQEEAEAIVSTVLNRQLNIVEKRKVFDAKKKAEDDAQKAYDDAVKAHDELGKSPKAAKEKLKKTGVPANKLDEEYAKAMTAAKAAYDNAKKALAGAQNARVKARSEKVAAEAYVAVEARSRAVTLTDIVTAPAPGGASQYMGYAPGKKLYTKYDELPKEDQERQKKRWTTALTAIKLLMNEPSKRKAYIEFRSNKEGTRTKKSNETRLGGNDFW